jgi:hypothetical protein
MLTSICNITYRITYVLSFYYGESYKIQDE